MYHPQDSLYVAPTIPEIQNSLELWRLFQVGLPTYMLEISISLLPIILFFVIFQLTVLKLSTQKVTKIIVGLIYTYVGLVLFLTGANVGFVPAGNYLGQILTRMDYPQIIVPIAMLMGYFIVKAEPAVYVLNKQVEEMTDGAITSKAMGTALSVGVAVSLGIAMIRVLTGISVLWILIPGYAVAIGISFFVPPIYTAVAFDAGGVASGPMATTFLLPLAQGACMATGGDIVTDAFGVVAMVAMTPLITVQVLGLVSQISKKRKARSVKIGSEMVYDLLDDNAIIDL